MMSEEMIREHLNEAEKCLSALCGCLSAAVDKNDRALYRLLVYKIALIEQTRECLVDILEDGKQGFLLEIELRCRRLTECK